MKYATVMLVPLTPARSEGNTKPQKGAVMENKGMQCVANGPDHISAKDWQLVLARETFNVSWDI